MDNYTNLLVGCGHSRDKRLEPKDYAGGGRQPMRPRVWTGKLETIDWEPACQPDMVWDLNITPWRRREGSGYAKLADESYDEIHAYEVLEHLGVQGAFKDFFETFTEMWRLLKPGGYLCATVPSRRSHWLLGDPGHTRVILPCTLIFLHQPEYDKQRGITSMSDYRRVYRADFDIIHSYDNEHTHQFILQAVKPTRCSL